jgi:O-acetyl-ADP-ribose deacetylase (regulator of RNase III)
VTDKVSRVQIVQGDITGLDVAAVVTAANEGLRGGGGVDGAVHRAAGPQLREACRQQAPCPAGQSRITPAFQLPVKWIIHTVGPVWQGGRSGEARLLRSAYRSALKLAAEYEIESLAFPCISTGAYGYPPGDAAGIAVDTVRQWIETSESPRTILFCCYADADFRLYQTLLSEG